MPGLVAPDRHVDARGDEVDILDDGVDFGFERRDRSRVALLRASSEAVSHFPLMMSSKIDGSIVVPTAPSTMARQM